MRQFLFFISFVLLSSNHILAQDSDTLTTDVEVIERYGHFSECLQHVFTEADTIKTQKGEQSEINWLKENRTSCDESSPITRRVAVSYLEWGDTVYDDKGVKKKKDKKNLFREALSWSRRSVREDSLDHLNYETLSMAFAAVISVSSLRAKARMADSVRVYAEEAIRLNPKNDRAHHILGRWHYEVSKLGWLTRTLAKVLFRSSADGSIELAIDYFKKALETDNIVVHRYWLGMVYLEEGDKKKALEQFRILQDIPIIQHNDQYFKNEAKKLIKKHE